MADLLLTPKQKAILDFITAFRGDHGYSPSQHEIAKHFGFKSLGTVQNYLVRLTRQGAIQNQPHARRGMLAVVPQPQSQQHDSGHFQKTVPLPLLGRVAAGRPIEAVQSEEIIEVPPAMLKGGAHFVLKVNGDSMIEQGILDGDYVVIKKQVTAHNGETVVALIDNSATIKKYYSKRGCPDSIELHPANPAYEPIIVQANSDFRIEGILAGVIRLMK